MWKDIKVQKSTNTREPLRCYTELRIDQRLENIVVDQHDSKLRTLTSDKLAAKKTIYYLSYYKTYTKPEVI